MVVLNGVGVLLGAWPLTSLRCARQDVSYDFWDQHTGGFSSRHQAMRNLGLGTNGIPIRVVPALNMLHVHGNCVLRRATGQASNRPAST